MTEKILTGILILAVLAVLLLGISFIKALNRMQKLMWDYEENGSAAFSTMKETRESKLENRLQRLLGQAAQKEEKAEKERDETAALLSDLSHQLKAPMANVIMYTELLEDESLEPEERRRFVQQTKEQARKMKWLLESMLKASRLETGSISFSAEYTCIRRTIGTAISGVYAKAEDKGITIAAEPFEDRKLYHDPKWTAEAIGNILDNAIKYSPSGSTVRVRVLPMEIYTQIEITDQGIGIAREEYNQIFCRFYRSHSVAQEEGSGLGLYLAQLILNKEKGYVTVASEKGKGSSFRIFLLNEVLTVL
nr:HAMP domain-containing sensor histidine kinase [uncultured Blautia sp.]